MSNTLPPLPARPYRRIATEEAFSPPEMLEIYKRILAKDDVDVGFKHLMGFYMSSPSARAQHIMRCLQDLDQIRLQHPDARHPVQKDAYHADASDDREGRVRDRDARGPAHNYAR